MFWGKLITKTSLSISDLPEKEKKIVFYPLQIEIVPMDFSVVTKCFIFHPKGFGRSLEDGIVDSWVGSHSVQ